MTPDLIYDQMIGMGMAKKIVFSYVAIPASACCGAPRDAIENGFPRSIEIEEHSHAGMANAYELGAAGLPCAVFRGYRGAGLAAVNPTSSRSHCPFTVRCWPPFPRSGPTSPSSMRRRPTRKAMCWSRHHRHPEGEAVLAARRAVVTVEEVVDNFDDLHPNLTVLPRWTIAAIIGRARRIAPILRARLLCA